MTSIRPSGASAEARQSSQSQFQPKSRRGARARVGRPCRRLSSAVVLLLVVGLLRVGQAAAAEPQPAADPSVAVVRFFALGDVPYSPSEHRQLLRLLAEANQRQPPFIIHVGDIKAGNTPCTEENLAEIAALFRAQPVPVAYTPGDNEWTDCRRAAAGGYDPHERLQLLRRLFFADPLVLRMAALEPVQPVADHPENAYFMYGGVMFALVHVVGSNNNRRPADAAAMAEFEQRSVANRHLLREAAAAAAAHEARAFVVIFHANPALERTEPPAGFVPLHQDLHGLLQQFPGPVLLIHGDTHWFRFDQPLRDPATGTREGRLWRLEVPGSPFVAGVWVEVEAGAPIPFRVTRQNPSPHGQLQEMRGD